MCFWCGEMRASVWQGGVFAEMSFGVFLAETCLAEMFFVVC